MSQNHRSTPARGSTEIVRGQVHAFSWAFPGQKIHENRRKSTKIDEKGTKNDEKGTKNDEKVTKNRRKSYEKSTKVDEQITKIDENRRKNYENRNQRYHYAAFSSPTPNFALPTLEQI